MRNGRGNDKLKNNRFLQIFLQDLPIDIQVAGIEKIVNRGKTSGKNRNKMAPIKLVHLGLIEGTIGAISFRFSQVYVFEFIPLWLQAIL